MYEPPKRARNFGASQRAGAETPAEPRVHAQAQAVESSQPSDVRNAQIRSRGALAPYFAVCNILGALIVGFALWSSTPPLLIGGWVAAVAAANFLFMRSAMTQALIGIGRLRRKNDDAEVLAGVMARALIWVSLPLWTFSGQDGTTQILIAAVMASLTTAAISLTSSPLAARAWVATITGALCLVLYLGSGTLNLEHSLAAAFIAGVGSVGVLRMASWSIEQIETVASVGSQSEQASLLLKEYEQRGAGWLWQVDSDNRVTYISARMASMLGRSTGQLVGHSLPASLGGAANLGSALLARAPFSALEMDIQTARGLRYISVAGDPIINSNGEFEGFRGVGSDITDVRQTQERLTHLANVDVLSGLPNRGRVRQLLGEALTSSQKTQTPCAILFLDLDGFKPVNDTYGHPKGDAVLKTVASRLVKEVGDLGVVGRMGGDEFAIVIPDAQSRKAIEYLTDRILQSIAEPYRFDTVEIRIGISIGCAFGPVDGQSVDDLILKADLALYEAKGQGRGRCCNFSTDLQNEAEDKVRLEQDLRCALGADEFHLLYQPLICATSQRLLGFEALLRWNHPERGIVPPNIFIPIAEDSNLIIDIGHWVINEACRAAATWPEHITVALNLSPRQLIIPALPTQVSEALTRHKLPGNRIELEVTESVFLNDGDGSLDVLKRLRTLGVGIALDDFGTGYSSLGYLNKAVFHKLKIDGSYVREAAVRQETVAIIKSIVQLAKNFRLNVTAEGVETVEDFERMRDLGCNTMQGYLFGRPMPYERANELVLGQMRKKAG